jgi:hypothetical protein
MKFRAGKENRGIKGKTADFPRRSLPQERGASATAETHPKLPLVECAHNAQPGEEMNPQRASEILLEEEAGCARDARAKSG